MRKLFILQAVLVIALASCDPANNNNNNGSGTCSGTSNTCFDLEGNTISGTAYWYDLVGSKMCVYVTDSVKTVSIDIGQYMHEQDYTVINGSLSSQYSRISYTDMSTMPYTDYKATSGTLTVTDANTTNNTISGTFTGVMQNQSTLATFNVTSGKFIDIPHQ